MKEESKRILISVITLATGIFLISFAVGFFSGGNELEETEEVQTNEVFEVETVPEKTQTPKKISYYLINEENGEIRLYFVEDGKTHKLRAEAISKELLPKEDINMLKDGIKTETGEEALAVWENFIS